jgi:hypothetical protein
MSNQQDFLFVDAAQAKTSRQGRRNARSFVMQNARRKNPWSTSKHAAKQRKPGSSESASPNSTCASTPNTTTPSPPIVANKSDYFSSPESEGYAIAKRVVCPDCQILLCRPGEGLCQRCVLLKPAAPAEDPNNQLFDPFRTSSVEVTRSVSELLKHCKWLHLYIYSIKISRSAGFVARQPCAACWPRAQCNGTESAESRLHSIAWH